MITLEEQKQLQNPTESEITDNVARSEMQMENHQSQAPSQKSNFLTYEFKDGKFEMTLRKYSLKIKLFHNEEQLQQAFSPSGNKVRLIAIFTKKNYPAYLKKHFKTIQQFYNFIYGSIKDEQMVTLSDCQLKLKVSGEEMPMTIDLKKFQSKTPIEINVQNMQDRLLSFSNKQIEAIEEAYSYFNGQPFSEEKQLPFPKQWLNYVNELDEEDFLQKETAEFDQQSNFPTLMEDIEQQTKDIDSFEQAFPQFKSMIFNRPSFTPDQAINPQTPSTNNGLFPPGYVPPHLAKPTAQDGLTSDQHLKFQANQTKKEKLKLAKQLLKMGFSTAEVISKLQAQDKSAKFGYTDPSTMSARGKSTPSVHNTPSIIKSTARPQQESSGDEKAVREMLISLIRAKTYKKLDEIQRHMANEGIHTTVQNLKRIIDEIKAKNAQRKAQAQGSE